MENRVHKMKNNKSQISLFLVVGVMLIVVTSFFIYMVNYTIKKETEQGVKKAQKTDLRSTPVEAYITSCLERTTKNGLKLLGSQGGVLYTDPDPLLEQGGITPIGTAGVDYLDDAGVKVWYAIREPIISNCDAGNGCVDGCAPPDPDCTGTCVQDTFCVIGCNPTDPDCGAGVGGCEPNTYSADPECGMVTCNPGDGCLYCTTPDPDSDPDCSTYTCPTNPGDKDQFCVLGCANIDEDCGEKGDYGFYGEDPNYPWIEFPTYPPQPPYINPPNPYNGYFGRNFLPPLQGSVGGITPIYQNLQSYISKKIKECIDLDVFDEQGFDIKDGATQTDVVFAEKHMSVTLTYPIVLTHTKTNQKITLNKFTYNTNFNLDEFYNYILSTTMLDIIDITFDPTGTLLPNFAANVVYSDHTALVYDDIITFTDSSINIDGNPFEFKVARKNRRPALVMSSYMELQNNWDVGMIFTSVQREDPDEDLTICNINNDDIIDLGGNRFRAECDDGFIELVCPELTINAGKKIGGPLDGNVHSCDVVKVSDGQFEDFTDQFTFCIDNPAPIGNKCS